MRFERYVAIGDSTSEGMDDPDGKGGYRGWANRLAERIAAQQGSLLYANLAIRGRTTRQVREEQLAPALAMRPDLSTVVAGTNDVLRRHFDADGFGADLEAMQSALVGIGATVLTFTLPDLTPVMPFARTAARSCAILRRMRSAPIRVCGPTIACTRTPSVTPGSPRRSPITSGCRGRVRRGASRCRSSRGGPSARSCGPSSRGGGVI